MRGWEDTRVQTISATNFNYNKNCIYCVPQENDKEISRNSVPVHATLCTKIKIKSIDPYK